MDLNDIRIVKHNLEIKLAQILAQEFKDFSRKTGIPIVGLQVCMLQMHSLDASIPVTEVTGVKIGVETGL